jgi:hypothetical protein
VSGTRSCAQCRAGRWNSAFPRGPPEPSPLGTRKTGLQPGLSEHSVTERGRTRKQLVRLDVDAVCRELTPADSREREAWLETRALMRQTVGESMFEICWRRCN